MTNGQLESIEKDNAIERETRMRALNNEDLPKSLWIDDCLKFPGVLARIYRGRLRESGLLRDACSDGRSRRGGPIGGEGEAESHEHFAHRFPASAFRAQYLLLNPKRSESRISDVVLGWASMKSVILLDLPCGAGATSLGLIATLHELRMKEVLPKLPINICIFGADVSEVAREHFGFMVQKLSRRVLKSGINLRCVLFDWDATKPELASQLMDRMLAHEANDILVMFSNFSGTITGSIEPYQRSFQHVAERLSNRNATMLVVEPDMPGAAKYVKKLSRIWDKLMFWKPSTYLADRYTYWHPIKDKPLRGTVYYGYYARKEATRASTGRSVDYQSSQLY